LQLNILILSIFLTLSNICSADEPRKVLKVKDVYSSEMGLTGNQFIIVKADRIIDVSKNFKKEETDIIFDYSHLIASPSLIEAHTHLFLEDKTYDENFSKSLVEISSTSTIKRMKMAKVKAASLLKAGFTTIRDLGNSGRYLDVSLKKLIEEGKVIGPDIETSGPGICINTCQYDEHVPLNIVKKEYDIVHNLKEGRDIINEHLKNGVEWIKIYSDNTPGVGMMSQKLLQELVRFSKLKKKKVAIHAIESKAVEQAVLRGVDSIEHIEELESAFFRKMKGLNISFVSTEFSRANFRKRHEVKNSNPLKVKTETARDFEERQKRLKEARNQKVNIAFGADFYFPVDNLVDNYGYEVLKVTKAYIDFGFTKREIMKMLTINGAKLLGKEKSIGKIKSSFKANLLLLRDNPELKIETLFKKNIVWKNGTIVQ
jgi:imidazolonepropionase-like amidohydrolase